MYHPNLLVAGVRTLRGEGRDARENNGVASRLVDIAMHAEQCAAREKRGGGAGGTTLPDNLFVYACHALATDVVSELEDVTGSL